MLGNHRGEGVTHILWLKFNGALQILGPALPARYFLGCLGLALATGIAVKHGMALGTNFARDHSADNTAIIADRTQPHDFLKESLPGINLFDLRLCRPSRKDILGIRILASMLYQFAY